MSTNTPLTSLTHDTGNTTGNTTHNTTGSTTGSAIADPPRRGLGDIGLRLAGSGAITFAAIVILQNIIRGAAAPSNGAATQEVLDYYADHRGITFALIGTFVLSGAGLAVFLGGVMQHLLASTRRAWALTGLVGGIGIMTLFSVVVGSEEALSAVGQRSQPNLGAVEALWALHNSVFTVLYLSIAVALLGLSRAGVAAGITPRVFERIAPIGSALLLIAAIAGPAIAIGDAMPMFALGGIGFLIWLAFVLTTGLRLVRSTTAR